MTIVCIVHLEIFWVWIYLSKFWILSKFHWQKLFTSCWWRRKKILDIFFALFTCWCVSALNLLKRYIANKTVVTWYVYTREDRSLTFKSKLLFHILSQKWCAIHICPLEIWDLEKNIILCKCNLICYITVGQKIKKKVQAKKKNSWNHIYQFHEFFFDQIPLFAISKLVRNQSLNWEKV